MSETFVSILCVPSCMQFCYFLHAKRNRVVLLEISFQHSLCVVVFIYSQRKLMKTMCLCFILASNSRPIFDPNVRQKRAFLRFSSNRVEVIVTSLPMTSKPNQLILERNGHVYKVCKIPQSALKLFSLITYLYGHTHIQCSNYFSDLR